MGDVICPVTGLFDDPGRYTDGQAIGRHVPGYNRVRRNDRMITNGDLAQHLRSCTYMDKVPNGWPVSCRFIF